MPSCAFLLLQDSTEDKDLWPQLIPDGVSEALSQPSLRSPPNREGHGFESADVVTSNLPFPVLVTSERILKGLFSEPA